jgi:hypothetical protein
MADCLNRDCDDCGNTSSLRRINNAKITALEHFLKRVLNSAGNAVAPHCATFYKYMALRRLLSCSRYLFELADPIPPLKQQHRFISISPLADDPALLTVPASGTSKPPTPSVEQASGTLFQYDFMPLTKPSTLHHGGPSIGANDSLFSNAVSFEDIL